MEKRQVLTVGASVGVKIGAVQAVNKMSRRSTNTVSLATQEALDAVIGYVNDSSPRVRKFVTRALGRMDMPEAKVKLEEIESKDTVGYIRTLASKYLRS